MLRTFLLSAREAVAGSRLAPLAALPLRLRSVARHDARVFAQSARWLVRSREHTNYTYGLTPLNLRYLAWWVSQLTHVPLTVASAYISEILTDERFVEHVRTFTASSDRRHLADKEVRIGRRAGWYAIVRATRPEYIVEAGTDKGLGSCVIASALLKNDFGQLTTMDLNRKSGYLIAGAYSEVTTRLLGDSVELLEKRQEPVDIFLHDSLHTREHELKEYHAVETLLRPKAVVLSDNAHLSDALAHWAEATGRSFFYFHEEPGDHWWPGDGIGAARF